MQSARKSPLTSPSKLQPDVLHGCTTGPARELAGDSGRSEGSETVCTGRRCRKGRISEGGSDAKQLASSAYLEFLWCMRYCQFGALAENHLWHDQHCHHLVYLMATLLFHQTDTKTIRMQMMFLSEVSLCLSAFLPAATPASADMHIALLSWQCYIGNAQTRGCAVHGRRQPVQRHPAGRPAECTRRVTTPELVQTRPHRDHRCGSGARPPSQARGACWAAAAVVPHTSGLPPVETAVLPSESICMSACPPLKARGTW